jgi:hypothetical protein
VNRFTAGDQIRHFVMAITGSMTALILKRAVRLPPVRPVAGRRL